ncbi:SDR family NAD(P)-dependent oxidoreductase [Cryptosporangium phraense]|uniref:SDR family oxidoreductase n=1 Tax=Cryptosporangium phraense TaxID=2593070 RepID=A0A545AXL2_9ACTN|nr:SDR family oxidoreductase [Cryptosporangium phraense]TQS46021.1 SDR family oxidoreductase [Cryptosporangium phraense]
MQTYSGSTALITGASAGIGAEFARQLAARGADLVLVARRKDRLDELADEIRAEHGVAVDVVPFDLGRPDAGRALREAVPQHVHLLVNNAGFGSYGPFLAEEPARIDAMIQLNVGALTELSRAFVPAMVEAGGGALLNVASVAAYGPTPTMPVYGATKAYVLNFTEALAYQLRNTGVRVLAFSPGATETEFFDVVGTREAGGGRWQTPAQVVSEALKALDGGAPSAVAGVGNRVLTSVARLFPRRVALSLAGRLTNA